MEGLDMEERIKNPIPHQEVHWIDVYVCMKDGTKWITKDEFTVQEFADFDSYIISVEGNISRYKYLHFYNYRTKSENEFSYYSSFYITGNKSKEVVEKYTLHFQLVKNPKELIGEIQDNDICSSRKYSKSIVLIEECGDKKILDGTWDATKYFIEYVEKLGEGE